jgi:hypothetical protein
MSQTRPNDEREHGDDQPDAERRSDVDFRELVASNAEASVNSPHGASSVAEASSQRPIPSVRRPVTPVLVFLDRSIPKPKKASTYSSL